MLSRKEAEIVSYVYYKITVFWKKCEVIAEKEAVVIGYALWKKLDKGD